MLIVVLDALAVSLLILLGIIIDVGGFVLHAADLSIRFRTPARTLLWLGIVVLLRIALDRHSPPFTVSRAAWKRVLIVPSGSEFFRVGAAAGVWQRAVLASLGIGAALAILMRDQLDNLYAVPDYGDPLFSMWRIGWVLHNLATDPLHLFDANIFYPERLTLTLSDPMILPALTAAPLLAAGVHPAVVYNLLLLSAFWVSGIATYLLVERLTGSARAAFIAGLVYASYSYRFDHYSHLELQMTQWMPLGLLALHLFVSTGRWRYAVALALAAVAQLYSSMYYAVFFLVYAVALAIGLVVIYRPPMRRLIAPAAGAAVVAGVLALPLGLAFAAAQPMKGERSIDEIQSLSARMSDYLRTHKYSAVWKDRLPPPELERALFPGAAPIALAAVGIAPPMSALRLAYAAGLIVSVDASRGFNGVIYPYLHRWLAPVRSLRVPSRFAAIVGLTLAIFAGFGGRRVMRWGRRPWSAEAALVLLTAAILVDARPSMRLTPVWPEPPVIYETLKGKPGVVLAEFPVIETENFNTPFMYFSLWHRKPMVNGYSGYIPPSYQQLQLELKKFPHGDTPDLLRRIGVTHVTANCGLDYQLCNDTLNPMRQSRDLRLIAETRWQGEAVQLYELIRK